jgi:hypothetical protein
MLHHSISQTIVEGTHQVLEVKRFESRRHADLRTKTGAELKKNKKYPAKWAVPAVASRLTFVETLVIPIFLECPSLENV